MGHCQQFRLTNSKVLHDTRLQLQNTEHEKRDSQRVLHSKNCWLPCLSSYAYAVKQFVNL